MGTNAGVTGDVKNLLPKKTKKKVRSRKKRATRVLRRESPCL